MIDILLEDQEQLESSPSPQEPVKGIKAVKEEPSVPSIGYKHVKHQTSKSRNKMALIDIHVAGLPILSIHPQLSGGGCMAIVFTYC